MPAPDPTLHHPPVVLPGGPDRSRRAPRRARGRGVRDAGPAAAPRMAQWSAGLGHPGRAVLAGAAALVGARVVARALRRRWRLRCRPHGRPGRAAAGSPGGSWAPGRPLAPCSSTFRAWPSAATRGQQVRDRPVLHLGGEHHGLRQRGVGVDRGADVLGVGAHLERVDGLGDQLAGADADDPGAEQAAGPGSKSSFVSPSSRPIEQRAAGGGPREDGLLVRARRTPSRRSRSAPSTRPRGRCRRPTGSRAGRTRRPGRRRSPRRRPCPRATPCGRASGRRRCRRSRRSTGTFVRSWASTGMKPRSSTVDAGRSASSVAPLGLRADRDEHCGRTLRRRRPRERRP